MDGLTVLANGNRWIHVQIARHIGTPELINKRACWPNGFAGKLVEHLDEYRFAL